jgi:SAM-dependent methyltransferase
MRDFNRLDLFIQRNRIGKIARHIPAGSTVLDLGCGYYPGALAALADRIERGVGIDRDIPEISPSPKINLIRADIEHRLPVADAEFDRVLMLAVLEHLNEPAKVIKECRRVLKTGGELIITIPSNFSEPLLITLANLGLISKEEIFDHKRYFNKKEGEEILSAAGLQKIVSRYYNFGLNLLFVYRKL